MKIAVWYHCKLSGEGIPSEDFAISLFCLQMQALKESKLLDEADEFFIGVNGPRIDSITAKVLSPCSRVHLLSHGETDRTEIPTLTALRGWAIKHADWFVLYHHMKGVTHPLDSFYSTWRQRMEDACVWNWRKCVTDLGAVADVVGCHWLTPERFRNVNSPFFGGNFWWAKCSYLVQLPVLPPPTWENRFEAEMWIGRRRPYPRIVDYHPGWP